ncbi:MAG TPA: hypothetical protein VGX78_05525, partial [Pirellulales bacterium]|nr:hypothetical protein [Pirellulales bacterium]
MEGHDLVHSYLYQYQCCSFALLVACAASTGCGKTITETAVPVDGSITFSDAKSGEPNIAFVGESVVVTGAFRLDKRDAGAPPVLASIVQELKGQKVIISQEATSPEVKDGSVRFECRLRRLPTPKKTGLYTLELTNGLLAPTDAKHVIASREFSVE